MDYSVPESFTKLILKCFTNLWAFVPKILLNVFLTSCSEIFLYFLQNVSKMYFISNLLQIQAKGQKVTRSQQFLGAGIKITDHEKTFFIASSSARFYYFRKLFAKFSYNNISLNYHKFCQITISPLLTDNFLKSIRNLKFFPIIHKLLKFSIKYLIFHDDLRLKFLRI